jgi:hypothetical protein
MKITAMDWLMNGFWMLVGLVVLAGIAFGLDALDKWLACYVRMPWASWC